MFERKLKLILRHY